LNHSDGAPDPGACLAFIALVPAAVTRLVAPHMLRYCLASCARAWRPASGECAVRLPSVFVVIAVAFLVALSMILLAMTAAITFASIRPDDAAGQAGGCKNEKCCCDSVL